MIPDVISEALIHLFGGTQLKKIPLIGRDFQSLRQLHFNGINKGLLCRRPVRDDLPLDYDMVDPNAAGIYENKGLFYCELFIISRILLFVYVTSWKG